MTEALPGESAVCEHWKRRFDKAVREIGEGLRAFHDSPRRRVSLLAQVADS